MNYDKVSFLSGVAVGRQLKGWGDGRRPAQDPIRAVIVRVPPTRITLGTVSVPGSLGAIVAAGLTRKTLPSAALAAAVPPGFGASVSVANITIEREE